MKAAHQGVPVVGLPGVRHGTPLTAGLHAVRRSADGAAGADVRLGRPGRAASADGGIDNWLINRLFGRR